MTSFLQIQPLLKNLLSASSSPLLCKDYNSQSNYRSCGRETGFSPRREFDHQFSARIENGRRIICKKRKGIVCNGFLLPVDPWAPNVDSQSIASQLFAFSLIPYLGFLYFITKSRSVPKLTLFGFYFLLAFVGATIPAGIYAKVHYGTSLSNVDWLHGGAESLLTLTNIFIVIGLREALRKAKDENGKTPNFTTGANEDEKPSSK